MAVTVGTGCSWTATSGLNWASILSGGSGSGNGTVLYSVDPNTGSASRVGTMTIAGQTFNLNQASGPAPNISVNPNSISFGNVGVGKSSSATVTVSNAGNALLTVNSISTSGSNANQFKQTNNCSSLNPGGSCAVTVTFAPNSKGAKNASLLIYSNDPGKNSVSVPLTGKGTRN